MPQHWNCRLHSNPQLVQGGFHGGIGADSEPFALNLRAVALHVGEIGITDAGWVRQNERLILTGGASCSFEFQHSRNRPRQLRRAFRR